MLASVLDILSFKGGKVVNRSTRLRLYQFDNQENECGSFSGAPSKLSGLTFTGQLESHAHLWTNRYGHSVKHDDSPGLDHWPTTDAESWAQSSPNHKDWNWRRGSSPKENSLGAPSRRRETRSLPGKPTDFHKLSALINEVSSGRMEGECSLPLETSKQAGWPPWTLPSREQWMGVTS